MSDNLHFPNSISFTPEFMSLIQGLGFSSMFNSSNSNVQTTFTNSIVNNDEIIEKLAPIINKQTLSNDVKLELIEYININMKSVVNIIFENKYKELWNFSVNHTKISEDFWDIVNAYVASNCLSIEEVEYYDKDFITDSYLYSNFSITENTILTASENIFALNLVFRLSFDKEKDAVLIDRLEKVLCMENYHFATYLSNIIKKCNKVINQGVYTPIADSKKYLSDIDQHKILYLLLSVHLNKNIKDEKFLTALDNVLTNFYVNLVSKKKLIKVVQSNIESSMYSYDQTNFIFKNMYIKSMKSLSQTKDIEKEIIQCLENQNINKLINTYFNNIITNNIYNDNNLIPLAVFYNTNKSFVTDFIAEVIVKIIKTKDYTNNPHIRSKFLETAVNYTDVSNIYKQELSEACVDFLNDVELNKDESMDLEKGFIRDDVYKYFKDNFNSEKVISIDKYKINSFINFVILDISNYFESVKILMDKYLNIDDDYELQSKTSFINKVFNYIDNGLITVNKFISLNEKHNIGSEIIIRFRVLFSNAITTFNKYFIEEGEEISRIEKYIYTKLDFDKPVIRLINIVHNFSEETLTKLFDETINQEIYEQVALVLSTIDSTITPLDVSKYITSDDIEYPDEFLDNITCELLTEPVIIPNTNNSVFLNKSTIVQYIMTDGTNPYTKESLTIKDLEDYNDTDESKKLISELNEKIKKFKENY